MAKTTKTTKKAVSDDYSALLSESEKHYESIVLSLAKVGLYNQIDSIIKEAKLDVSSLLEQEANEYLDSQLQEIVKLINSTSDKAIKDVLITQADNLLESKQNESLLSSSGNWQESIDDFFMTGLKGEKKKSMLAKTEVEASVSGTNAINYLFRQALIKKEQHINVNSMLEQVTKLTGRYYRSIGHIRVICKALNDSKLCKASLKNKQIHLQY